MRHYVLASASPRRRELLKTLLPDFEIRACDIDENLRETNPRRRAMRLSLLKAGTAARSVRKGSVVIGADTIVALHHALLGKPRDEEDAARMLRLLSGRSHFVYTGVTVIDTETGKALTACEKTAVTFGSLSEEEIQAYVQTGEPMDKAGAYAIQGVAARWISRVNGCYFNVVGLPVHRLYGMLGRLGCRP